MAFLSGLLDSNLMPGEGYGMPNQGGLLNAKFNDPMLQVGLGILANNNSRDFGQVVGRGAMQGFQNASQQQQYEQQRKMQDLQGKRFERQDKQFEAEEAAHADFDAKYPEYKGLSRIDPKTAIKIANPAFATNGADPYYTPISTAGGLGSFDNRSGKFVLVQDAQGRPIVKAADSPELQGNIELAKSKAEGSYKIDTSIPGRVQTITQTAEQAMPSLVNPIPQTAPSGQPSFTVPPAVQAARDDKRLQILLAEQQADGGAGKNPELDKEIARFGPRAGGGIAVPTAAQLAADKTKAEFKAETEAKAQVGLPNVIQESKNTIGLIDDLLKSPGLKTAVGGSRMFGLQNIPGTAAKDFDVRLDQLKGKQFLQAYESLKGAGAITDIEGTKAGNAIARMDASASEKEFIKAAREFQGIISQGLERAKAKAGGGAIMSNNEAMPEQPRRRIFNPKTGKIE
jgi:hypothetical protein